jgi:phosphatidylserine/phosphatidylglycerophosphate/cardiolipin synthase-like enzyme
VRVAKKSKLLFVILIFAALYTFLIKAALNPAFPTPASPLILYSNQNRDDLRLVLKETFNKAAHSLHIWMYAATDSFLLSQLQKKAEKGVFVSLHVDKGGGTPALPSSLHPTVVKSKGLMHKKIVIADDHLVYLGSANMTTSSLQLHDNLSVGIYHHGLAEFLKAPPQKNYSFKLDQTQGLLWLLPDPLALKAIEQEIDGAHSSIFIAMFTLTEPTLINALIRAHHRGVHIKLALDRYTARGASKKAVQKLKEAGIEIVVSSSLPLLHHKWAYIDRSQLILGSTNWTTSAFQKNEDVLLFLCSLPNPFQKQLEKIISAIELESNPSL